MTIQSRKTTIKFSESLKKALASVFIMLTMSVGASIGVEPGQECGGPLSYIPFVNITESMAYFTRCAFPTDKLNSDCMLSSCPQLNGLSPMNSEGSVDQTAVESIVNALNDCFHNTPTICGINFARLPMVQQGWTFDELIPAALHVNGSCILNAEGGSINNLNQAVFSLPPQQNPKGPVIINVLAPLLTQTSHWACLLSVPNTIFNPLQAGSIQLLNFPDTLCQVNITVTPTVTIDVGTTPPTFTIAYGNFSSIVSIMSNFAGCGISLPQVLVNFINVNVNQYFKSSQTTNYATNILATLASAGFGAAIQSCR